MRQWMAGMKDLELCLVVEQVAVCSLSFLLGLELVRLFLLIFYSVDNFPG